MKHNATHLPVRDWCVPCIAGKKPDWPHSRITHSSTAVPMYQLDHFFLHRRGDTDILTALNFKHCPSGASLVQCCDKGKSKTRCPSIYDFHEVLGTPEDLFANRWRTCLGCCSASNQERENRRDAATTPRNSSSSLGAVEHSNRSVEGQIRCMRIALEKSANTSSSGSVDMRVGSARDFTCRLPDSRFISDYPTVESWQSSESRST